MAVDTLPVRSRQLIHQVMAQMLEQSKVTERILDPDLYHVQISLLWIQLTVSPEQFGLTDNHLEAACRFVNQNMKASLGHCRNLDEIFVFLLSDAGQKAMNRLKISSYQKDLIDYFGVMITDPQEHQRRISAVRKGTGR